MDSANIFQETPSILVVDDTPANLQVLTGMLKTQGYKVRPARSGKLALMAAQSVPPDLVLLDINMPEMNGYEVCQRLKADRRLADIPVIFLSALSETDDKVKAFEVGGVDYITKPFEFAEIDARVRTHLKLHTLQAALEMHNQHLQELVEKQVRENLATKEELSEAQLATIVALSKLAEARDDDTGQHIERTQVFCRIVAEQLRRVEPYAQSIDDEFVANIFHAAPLHDIGKVAIPDAILQKPAKLSPQEFAIMKTHTTLGAKTLRAVHARHSHNAFITLGIEIAHFHHEKWDGSGYPCGLSDTAIPLSARIMALADVYDALTSARCYKKAFSHVKSREIIMNRRGTQFDPAVVEAFLTLESKFHEIRQSMNDRVSSPTPHSLFEESDVDRELELLDQIVSCNAVTINDRRHREEIRSYQDMHELLLEKNK